MAFRDCEEFIAALNAHGARYLVVGAHAVAFHARPRPTKDLHMLIDPRPGNARRLQAALREFFAGADLGYSVGDVIDPRWMIQLGVAPVRIGLISEMPGLASFKMARRKRVCAPFGSLQAHYIGLDELIRAEKGVRRLQDRPDLRILERARGGTQLTCRFTRCQGTKRRGWTHNGTRLGTDDG